MEPKKIIFYVELHKKPLSNHFLEPEAMFYPMKTAIALKTGMKNLVKNVFLDDLCLEPAVRPVYNLLENNHTGLVFELQGIEGVLDLAGEPDRDARPYVDNLAIELEKYGATLDKERLENSGLYMEKKVGD